VAEKPVKEVESTRNLTELFVRALKTTGLDSANYTTAMQLIRISIKSNGRYTNYLCRKNSSRNNKTLRLKISQITYV
jgi:hypothetical protein